MSLMPQAGDEVKTVKAKLDCKIKESIGDGTQGKVYKAEYGDQQVAVKWYKPSKATTKQKEIIEDLIKEGAPCDRFLWPFDLVYSSSIEGFGYIMELRKPGYKSIAELVARRVNTNYRALCTVGYQLADSYRKLHSRGYCYRDINFDNIFFNPRNGEISICDNDNVGINNESEASVLGTQRFMAPEVVRGETTPNTSSDIFSLAVLLFYIFMNSHPLHGKQESKIRCFDLPAMQKIYGQEPVFIFDPDDDSNRPVPGEHQNAIDSWPIYPEFIRELFTQTFTEGLNNVNKRVREGQWRSAMLRLRDSIFYCVDCGGENFYDPQQMDKEQPGECCHCAQELVLPYRIKFDDNEQKIVMLNSEAKLYPHHTDKNSKRDFSKEVAELTQHPKKPSVWGLKNLSDTPWSVTNNKGEIKEVVPERSIALAAGVKIDFGNRVGEIIY
ncbi:serine/threonine protein kinase [Fuchsiella alkaliacetigena]|uniref:serine/threonine protein kinase n=1 Tax=Fuchsiella alkaliacetigena TaxID=957042 RepID=UPI00200B17DA|nr:serine/threonine-protein kinase [Fuchsiella alkaliacetigena]MCK8823582.1 serine/threonine-protein kinase [Fuchsiella alkaliacetigena]